MVIVSIDNSGDRTLLFPTELGINIEIGMRVTPINQSNFGSISRIAY